VLEAGASSTLFPLRELSKFLEGILLANHGFQSGERFILFHVGLFRQVEETQISLQKHHLC
jgi:hypothetical protein